VCQDKESVYNLVKMIDKTNGYVYGSFIPGNDSIMTLMESSATTWQYDKFAAVQERYTTNDDDDDDEEGVEDEVDDDDDEGEAETVARRKEDEAPPRPTAKGKEKDEETKTS
jgi:hypothetical protein